MLVFAGLSHASTPLELRERCAVPVEERARVQSALCRQFGTAVLLSTCGRVELYIDAPGDEMAARSEAVAWLARRAGVDSAGAFIQSVGGADAVRRIFRVACGLESALEGEDEILGQVRRAWLDAGLAGALSPALDAAFRLAVRTGRQARRTGDAAAWTSLADVAARHAGIAVGERTAPRVLIAGSGPMGMRAARTLREQYGSALEMAMAGRTPARVATHAAQVDARPLTLMELPAALEWADAAIVGLRTRQPLIGAAQVGPRSPERPLLIVDLSLPRAVDQSVDGVPGVRLRNVDHLAGNEGSRSRWDGEARARVDGLIEKALADYAALTERSDALTTLTTLRIQADGVRRAQLARTFRRLPHLDAETRWAVDALTRALVNRLLHEPTMRLKAGADETLADQVRELFGLQEAAER